MPTIYFIPGDSYPKDSHVDVALAERLARRGSRWVSPADTPALTARLAPGDNQDAAISARLAAIGALIADDAGPAPPILIGRSSGACVATLLAGVTPVSAVVCLGYPFRFPGRDLERRRYGHLAGLAAPTLILQGESDPYGGRGELGDYPLSPAVRIQHIKGEHAHKFSPEGWDVMAGLIGAFLEEAGQTPRAAA